MNFKLILCGLGFHYDLKISFKSGRETNVYHCSYCDTWITVTNGKKSSSKKE